MRSQKNCKLIYISLIMFLSFVVFTVPVSAVAVSPDLESASPYGILGETTTVTESTHVVGSLGSGGATGTANVTGLTSVADEAYRSAFTDFGLAMDHANTQEAEHTLSDSDIGGQTLTPGVHKSTNAVSIGSSIILDGDGVYIFQIGGGLTTAANTEIQLEGGAQACNIYWVADVATIGADSTFEGTLMSESAITLGADSVTNGRMLAQTAVTANAANTQINVPADCDETTVPTPTPEPTPELPIEPEPTPELPIEPEPTPELPIEPVTPEPIPEQPTEPVTPEPEVTPITDTTPAPEVTPEPKITQSPEVTPETPTSVTTTPEQPTGTGDRLPNTSTSWYNLLLVGAVLSMTGLAFFIRRKIRA